MSVYNASGNWLLDGHNWYARANDYATSLAYECGKSVETTSAVISAVSPGITWYQNKLIARQLCLASVGNFSRELAVNFPMRGAYRRNANKAWNILQGKDPYKLMSPITGPKTFNFWHNIMEPSSKRYVTIDRHAYSIALGEKTTKAYRIDAKRYALVSDLYKQAAKDLGVIPCQLQATVWLAHRDRYQQNFLTMVEK
jgi:hypothetical protein